MRSFLLPIKKPGVILMRCFILAVAIVIGSASTAVADDRFDRMDVNKDGKVTWEAFEATHPGMRKEAFDTIDTNQDGFITRDEWEEFRSGHDIVTNPDAGGMVPPGMPTMMQGQKEGMGKSGKPSIVPPK
jgi:hypothetical protein